MDNKLNKSSVVPLTKRPMVFWAAWDKILASVQGGDSSTLLSSGMFEVDCSVQGPSAQERNGHTAESNKGTQKWLSDRSMKKGWEL